MSRAMAAPTTGTGVDGGSSIGRHSAPSLRLLREAKISQLLGDAARDLHRLEASGVLVEDGCLWVIFDNVPYVARLDPELTPGHPDTLLLRQPVGPIGYEDIALDRVDGRYFLLIESAERAPGLLMAQVWEFDHQFRRVGCGWLDVRLERANKGIEGLTVVRRDGLCHLLGLCEGNLGRGGKAGRRPGGGRVHVFTQHAGGWDRVDTVALPAGLWFTDYSGISVSGEQIAVVSQESSALWVGRLHPDRWEVVDDGTTYMFPRDCRGRTLYGNIEGVSWLSERSLVVVSDRAKRSRQPTRVRAKDQSVHVFELPAPVLAGAG